MSTTSTEPSDEQIEATKSEAVEAWPWTLVGEGPTPSRRDVPCGSICGPEGCMARGCPVAR